MILFHFVRMQELMFQQKLKIIWLNIFLKQKNISDQDYYLFCYDILGIQRHLKVLGIFVDFQKEIKRYLSITFTKSKKNAFINIKKKINSKTCI